MEPQPFDHPTTEPPRPSYQAEPAAEPPQPSPLGPPRQPTPPDYWQKPKRRWWIYAAIVIALVIIAAAAYWFLLRSKPAPKPAQTPVASQTQTKPTAPLTTPVKTYNSTNFNLSFSYPQDWAITDGGTGQMTARSPATPLKDASGQSVNGQIIMTIAKKGQNLGVFDKGDAAAVLDSQKVSYTNPTSAQRANTYLSYLQYATTATTGALDGIYITGDFGYQKGQNIPKADIANIDPLVTVTFVKCATAACPAGTTTALSIASSSWSDASFSAPITKMLESLAFN